MKQSMSSRTEAFRAQLVIWTLLVAAAAGAGLFLAKKFVWEPAQEWRLRYEEAEERINHLQQEKERLETFLRLLKYTERRARVEVLSQTLDASNIPLNTLRFQEITPDGRPAAEAMEIELSGKEIYFDTLVISFEDAYVENADPLRGRSLLFFRRVFSEEIAAKDGVYLNAKGQEPLEYVMGKAKSDFERDLWHGFWTISNDEELAKEKGIRAIHGKAPFQVVEPGKVYEIALRSTGDLEITPGRTVSYEDGPN